MQLFNSLIFMLGAMAPYILLGFFKAGLMHAFVARHAMSRHLAGPGIGAVVKAALFGITLPLCSCVVQPTAIAMRRGLRRGMSGNSPGITPQRPAGSRV